MKTYLTLIPILAIFISCQTDSTPEKPTNKNTKKTAEIQESTKEGVKMKTIKIDKKSGDTISSRETNMLIILGYNSSENPTLDFKKVNIKSGKMKSNIHKVLNVKEEGKKMTFKVEINENVYTLIYNSEPEPNVIHAILEDEEVYYIGQIKLARG